MTDARRYTRRWVWAILALGLTSTSCSHLRPKSVESDAAPIPTDAPLQANAVEPEAPPPARNNHRLILDPEQIAALQDEHLAEQEDVVGILANCPTLIRRLDRWHRAAYKWMDNTVRSMDTRWLKEDTPYEAELSTFKVDLHTRVGGRSSNQDFDLKARVRVNLALPGLEDKLYLMFADAGHDYLPGTDPLDQKNDMRIGLKTAWRTIRHSQISLGGGGRFSGWTPVLYADVDWRWQRPWAGGELRLRPRGFWYSDDGLGQLTTVSWTRRLTERQVFQIRGAEKSTEKTDGLEFEQSFRFAWLRSGEGRGWLVQVSVFPHLKSSEWYVDRSLVNLTWRDAFYRKWIYYTLTPQLEFPREDDYRIRPSIRMGLEILFGGTSGHLM